MTGIDHGSADGGRTRTTNLVILLAPAVILAGFTWWLLFAKWIGVAVLVVGVLVAALGSRGSPRPNGLALLVVIQIALLVSTAVVGVMIDCALHCS